MTQERRENIELALEYELFGAAPVQATGTICGREFYFRARHDSWEFEVAKEDGRLGSDCDEEPFFLRAGEAAGASFLSHEEAHRLIEKCAEEFFAQWCRGGGVRQG
jgi:hypothetical protein